MFYFSYYILYVIFCPLNMPDICKNAKFQTLYAENRKSKIKWKSLPLRSDKMKKNGKEIANVAVVAWLDYVGKCTTKDEY